MKTINDFKIIDGIAILEGVAYLEEARVVDEFLKINSTIQYASVVTNDNRYFELSDGKLILSKETKFNNPYFKSNSISKGDDEILSDELLNNNNNYFEDQILHLEERVKILEHNNNLINKTLLEITELLNKLLIK